LRTIRLEFKKPREDLIRHQRDRSESVTFSIEFASPCIFAFLTSLTDFPERERELFPLKLINPNDRKRPARHGLCDFCCVWETQYLSDHTDGWSAIFSARVLTEIRPLSLRYRASHAMSFSLFFLSFTFYKHSFFCVVNEQLEANIFRLLLASNHELINVPVSFSTRSLCAIFMRRVYTSSR